MCTAIHAQSGFAKESTSPALLTHAWVVNSLRNSYWFAFFQIRKDPRFASNAMRVVSKFKIYWTPLDNSSLSWKFEATAATQWSTDPCPFEIFLSPLHHLCWLWCVLMHETKFSRTISGLQWYMGRCQAVQLFVRIRGTVRVKWKGPQGDGECEDVENMRVKLPSVCSHEEDYESKMKGTPGRWWRWGCGEHESKSTDPCISPQHCSSEVHRTQKQQQQQQLISKRCDRNMLQYKLMNRTLSNWKKRRLKDKDKHVTKSARPRPKQHTHAPQREVPSKIKGGLLARCGCWQTTWWMTGNVGAAIKTMKGVYSPDLNTLMAWGIDNGVRASTDWGTYVATKHQGGPLVLSDTRLPWHDFNLL